MPIEPDLDLSAPDPDQGHAREWPSTPYSDEARALAPALAEATCIALIGDCTVAGTLWPPANRPENILAVRLRRAFPGMQFVVCNFADDGGTAAGFLTSGGIERVAAALPRIDVAYIRFGINDRKVSGVEGCLAGLKQLCSDLKAQFDRVHIVIETGIWVHYPAHYLWDRNSRLEPLYGAMSETAAELGMPCLDIFNRMRLETERGNRDLRVRGLPSLEHTVLDDSLDEYYGDDPAFFTNIHPNSRCMGLIADWEVETLQGQL